ncbi:MAG: biotin-dependent carboxyltransferase family protein [Fusobacteriaceae bacterium]|jgi:biotin-dependent carboxylase-like uncharacterized protein|nr:biotin-dependent carboxyltransferase family protein [Fusobacteriaceae bacterium]
METLKILESGLLTTVQDLGRYGYQRYGIAVGGVMDAFSAKVANRLVGNKAEDAVLETTLKGVDIAFVADCVFAVTGGKCACSLNGKPLSLWRAYRARTGDVLKMGICQEGVRNYLAFSGGIDVPLVLSSRSTNLRANFGGFQGRDIKMHDVLRVFPRYLPDIPLLKFKDDLRPVYPKEVRIRVILGQQSDYFTEKGVKTFFADAYKITPDTDRIGMRLLGKKVAHKETADIISDGITFGAIQIIGNGQPVVLMADRQTTGGYTKIGNVITADLHMLAQALQGTKVRFVRVTVEEALEALGEFDRLISDDASYEQIFELPEKPVDPPIYPGLIPVPAGVNGKKYVKKLYRTCALLRPVTAKYTLTIADQRFEVEVEKIPD